MIDHTWHVHGDLSPPMSELACRWAEVLHRLSVCHPNGRSRAVLRLLDGEPPQLYVGLDETSCTKTGALLTDFAISTVKLTYWPGDRLARAWFTAAWLGYLQHEALELVTLDGAPVLDPHAEPYATNPLNRGLRVGFPVELNPTTLFDTLLLVMDEDDALKFVNQDRAMWLGLVPESFGPGWMR